MTTTAFLEGTAFLSVAAFVLSVALTGLTVRILRRRAILDQPNERSSHTIPTPRGGGWGLLLALLPFWVWASWRSGRLVAPHENLALAGVALLMAISWIDDRRGLGPALRFGAQAIAVGAVMAALPDDLSLSAGWLPTTVDRVIAGFLWLWFVNLFNFMDGIDGITGGTAMAMGLGVALVWARFGSYELEIFRAMIIAAAALGFLVWNWSPAKVFMGDVGSVPLGYLLGYMLVVLAMDAKPIPALIIALYYLSDATITLLRRLFRGEKIWRAHREHFYQRSVQRGRSHALTAGAAIAAQLALALIAGAGRGYGLLPLVPAGILVACLLAWMAWPRKAAP